MLFRHIACLFNGEKVDDIKLLLADSDLDVNIGLKTLIDKSLIHVIDDTIEMHRLIQDMGKEIVRGQSDEPGGREFLVDSKEICDLFKDNAGTKKVLGISLNTDEIDELRIHNEAFEGMINLRFLNIYTNKLNFMKKEGRWHLQECFNFLPPKLRLLRLDGYPMRCMPSNFCPENLVKLKMRKSKLKKLWEGVHPLSGLKHLDLRGSQNLREIPDLTMTTNLETLNLALCSSLVELPSSIRYLNKLIELNMSSCQNLETLPTGINLQSLHRLSLKSCNMLRSFPDISTNISDLNISYTKIQKFPSNLRLENLVELKMNGVSNDKLWERVQPLTPLLTMLSPFVKRLTLSAIPSLVELPCSLQYLNQLEELHITECTNLETLPTDINLQSLDKLILSGCSRLKSFTDISTNVSYLNLIKTGIDEVPWWIEKFYRLSYLHMRGCKSLIRVSLNISKLRYANFSDCGELTEVSWNDTPSELPLGTVNTHSNLPDKDSSSLPDNYFRNANLKFTNCFKLDIEALLEQHSVFFPSMIFSGEQVPSYFTPRTTTRTSLINIPSFHTSPSQPFLRCRVCATGYLYRVPTPIVVCCRFIDRLGNHFDFSDWIHRFTAIELTSHLVIFNCFFNLPQLNYDEVDVQFQIASDNSKFKIKGWGVQVLSESEDCTPFSYIQTGNPNTIACVNMYDNGVETERSRKRIKVKLALVMLLFSIFLIFFHCAKCLKSD